jgi:hypothetical protein
MIDTILALQDLPSLITLGVDSIEDTEAGGSCTACSYTCSKTLSE